MICFKLESNKTQCIENLREEFLKHNLALQLILRIFLVGWSPLVVSFWNSHVVYSSYILEIMMNQIIIGLSS